MPSSDIKFLLRVPVELDGKLRAEAIAEKVSLNVVIVRILARDQGVAVDPVKKGIPAKEVEVVTKARGRPFVPQP